jgi:arsenate reductase
VRVSQPEYAAAGLGPASDESELLEALEREPILLERPIVVRGNQARVGRPPQAVLELFE